MDQLLEFLVDAFEGLQGGCGLGFYGLVAASVSEVGLAGIDAA